MARRKLKPGVHNVVVGGKRRRVKVLANGQWRFLKGTPRSKASSKGPKASAKRGKAKRTRKGTSPGRRNTMARRKMSLPNRAINFVLFLMAFSRPLSLLIRSPSMGTVNTIVHEASAGLITGKLDLAAAGRMYAPAAGAFILFEVKKMAMKKFRF